MNGEGRIPKPERGMEVRQVMEAENAGSAFLIYRDAEDVLVTRALERESTLIGRVEPSAVILDWDGGVSRIHAEVVQMGGAWGLADDGMSRNGSFVNGERVTGRRILSDGAVLRFGDTLLVFRDPSRLPSGTTTVTANSLAPPDLSPSQTRVLNALCRPALTQPVATFGPPTNRQISEELFLSLDAVKGHLRVLFIKFSVEGLQQNQKRAALVDRAIRSGAVTPSTLK